MSEVQVCMCRGFFLIEAVWSENELILVGPTVFSGQQNQIIYWCKSDLTLRLVFVKLGSVSQKDLNLK